MSADALIAELEALPEPERSRVLAHFVQKSDDSWVPESFKRGMADIEAGRVYPMEDVMNGAPPPPEK
jgi:predicted transcriptional regulator